VQVRIRQSIVLVQSFRRATTLGMSTSPDLLAVAGHGREQASLSVIPRITADQCKLEVNILINVGYMFQYPLSIFSFIISLVDCLNHQLRVGPRVRRNAADVSLSTVDQMPIRSQPEYYEAILNDCFSKSKYLNGNKWLFGNTTTS
jgi:hypothetical protein